MQSNVEVCFSVSHTGCDLQFRAKFTPELNPLAKCQFAGMPYHSIISLRKSSMLLCGQAVK